MQSSKKLNTDIELSKSLKSLVQAYEEIAVMKMRKVRDKVLDTRDYIQGLSQVFSDVRYSYRNEVEALLAKNKAKWGVGLAVSKKSGKSIIILLSTNARLSGSIGRRVFSTFVDEVKKNPQTDIMIVGRVGKDMFDEQNSGRSYTYFDAPQSVEDVAVLNDIITVLMKYQNVTVHHGQFFNLLRQETRVSNITGDEAVLTDDTAADKDRHHFLFEPSLEDIFHFFEVQIMVILFRQSINESGLANLGSRITAMEEANINIERYLVKLKSDKLKLQKSINNKKQLQLYAGMSLWNCR